MDDVDYENITEPHDFRNEPLIALDSALRCSICKDLINIPMITPCSHSFCSLCIRETLSTKPECPVCRAATSDGQLKKNTMLFEAVDAYNAARELILKHERTVEKGPSNAAEITRATGKRKRSEPAVVDGEISKVPRLQNHPSDHSKRNHSNNSLTPSKSRAELSDEQHVMVSCPVCDEILDSQYINQHLDSNCTLDLTKIKSLRQNSRSSKDGDTQAKAWANVFSSGIPSRSSKGKGHLSTVDETPMKRLSKVNYDIKSMKQLRELLAEAGLSDKGDIPQLKLRHERWVNLWNAEMDAKHPRSRHHLLKDMAEWENARSKSRPLPKVENTDKWLDTNRQQFDLLVSTARLKPRGETNIESDPDTAENTIEFSSSPPPT